MTIQEAVTVLQQHEPGAREMKRPIMDYGIIRLYGDVLQRLTQYSRMVDAEFTIEDILANDWLVVGRA